MTNGTMCSNLSKLLVISMITEHMILTEEYFKISQIFPKIYFQHFNVIKNFGPVTENSVRNPFEILLKAWPVMIDEFVEFVKKDKMEN